MKMKIQVAFEKGYESGDACTLVRQLRQAVLFPDEEERGMDPTASVHRARAVAFLELAESELELAELAYVRALSARDRGERTPT